MPPTIRPATDSDARQIAAIYAPYVRDTAISFEVVPPTGDAMGERIRIADRDVSVARLRRPDRGAGLCVCQPPP